MGQRAVATDILIVGGGAMGCSLAFHLAQRGRAPLLLERSALGGGSTGRCAGGVRQQFSTPVNILLGKRSIELLREFPATVGADPRYQAIGYLLLATSAPTEAELRRDRALQLKLGIAVEALTADEVANLVPGLRTDDVTFASFCQSDGIAGPNEVTLGYATAARRLGATIEEGVEVQAIETGASHPIRVHTSALEVRANQLVICAGPQSRSVAAQAGLDVPVSPLRRHILLTNPFPGQPPAAPMTIDLETTFYFHPEGESLLMGMADPSEKQGEDISVNWDFLPQVVSEGAHRLPALAGASLRTAWAGLYEMTPDRQPLVGRSAELDSIWLACGFSGHGFMMAPPVGESLAAIICGEAPAVDLETFSPKRFADRPLNPERVFI
jgi:sarcosine oxidase subunit beta